MMKSFLFTGTLIGFFCVPMQIAIAKEAVITSVPASDSSIHMEINPFMHSKRIMRTDRVSYPVTKGEKMSENGKKERVIRTDRVSYATEKQEIKSVEKKRIIRNDRVVFNQAIDPS